MTPEHLRTLILRDLDALVRELNAYPDEASVWARPEGIPNSAGTLALHMAGNLHHFFGAILGDDGYVRDREGEFGDRDVPRAQMVARIRAAARAVDRVLSQMDPAELERPFPVELSAGRPPTGLFLAHLATHLSYHLGQVDYHRRLTTGDGTGVDALSLRAISEVQSPGGGA